MKVIADRLRGLEQKKDRFFHLYGEEEIDRTMLAKKFAEINEEARRLEQHRDSYTGQKDDLTLKICTAIDELRDQPAAFLATDDLARKSEILRSFADEIKFDGDHVQIVWKKPYSFVMRPGLVGEADPKSPKNQKIPPPKDR